MISPAFAWIDLETTGLDPDRDSVLAVGLVITGPRLTPHAEGEWLIWQPQSVLDRMSPAVVAMHRAGLFHVSDAPEAPRVDLVEDAERAILSLLAAHTKVNHVHLAGSSPHFDRAFLRRWMPAVDRWLHHRHLDVSSLRILAEAWGLEQQWRPSGPPAHTPLADLSRSLDELRHYRDHLLAPEGGR